MVTRKYTSDYRMEFSMDSRGRVREIPVYCGAYYRFEAEPEAVRKSTLWLIVLLLATAVTTLLPMLIRNEYAREFYAFLPQAFALIPLYMFAASLWRILTVKGDVIREHRDRIVSRLHNASVFFLVVSVLSAVGAIAFLIIDEPGKTDWAMIAVNLLRLPIAWLFFPMGKRFAMKQVDTPKTSE